MPRVPSPLASALNDLDELPPAGWGPVEELSTPYMRAELPPEAIGALRRAAQESAKARAAFHLRQEWLGRVEEVHEDHFQARLYTRRDDAEELADIWIEELSPADQEQLRPGAVFYWTIGYRDEPWGQRRNVSTFHFRRVPPLDENESARAQAAATDLEAWIQQE